MADLEQAAANSLSAIEKRAKSDIDSYQVPGRAVRYTRLRDMVEDHEALLRLKSRTQGLAQNAAEVLT